MKTTKYLAMAAIGSMMLASCASDEPLAGNDYDGVARFSVQLPGELATRFNDGKAANKLYYSVFQNNAPVMNGVITDAFKNGLTQDVDIQLVANQEYQIVFFADNSAAEAEGKGYTYNAETAQFDVTYVNDMVNSDNYDAFVNKITYTATGQGTPVQLKRPFAQLNIGTNDLTNGAVTNIGLGNFSSTLTIKSTGSDILSGINFLSGEETAYTGTGDLTFNISSFASLPADEFPVPAYSYIEMNYLLVAATEEGQNSLINAEYVITANGVKGNSLNLSATPVKNNYQTNVYGSLLTTQNKFNVEIVPAFAGTFDTPVWDGTSAVAPAIDEATKTVTIATPAHLAGFAQMVNGSETQAPNLFKGYTVKLQNDIDLAGKPWTPIAYKDPSGGGAATAFQGTFDGQGHTIYNLNVAASNADGGDMPAGLFGLVCQGGVVKNLNINKFTITGNHFGAALVGYSWEACAFSNCNVSNGTVTLTPNQTSEGYDNGDKAGAITGYSNATITNCSADNVKITAYRDLGGLVGYNWGQISNCKVTNSQVIRSTTNEYEVEKRAPYGTGYIVGFSGLNNYNYGSQMNNTYSNVTISGLPTDNYTYISTKQELINFANDVNVNKTTYAGKNVVLLADIDLGGAEWAPIGLMTAADLGNGNNNGARFQGTFNGNGHAVYNFKVNQTGDYAVAGFFGRVSGQVTIKNLKVMNATINSNHYAGGIVAYIYMNGSTNTATVDACATIDSSVTSTPNLQPTGKYDNGDKVGGLIGYINVDSANSKCVVSNSTVYDSQVEGYRDLGGFIGRVANKSGSYTGSENSIRGTIVTQNLTHNYNNITEGTNASETVGKFDTPMTVKWVNSYDNHLYFIK